MLQSVSLQSHERDREALLECPTTSVLYASLHIPVVQDDHIHAIVHKHSHLGRLSGEGDI